MEEQNRSLVFAKASQENLNSDSEKSLRDLQRLESELSDLQEKYQVWNAVGYSFEFEMFKLSPLNNILIV